MPMLIPFATIHILFYHAYLAACDHAYPVPQANMHIRIFLTNDCAMSF
jgi:hypothetical protein